MSHRPLAGLALALVGCNATAAPTASVQMDTTTELTGLSPR